MDTGMIDENTMPLSEFVKLPTTVDFQVINTDRFKVYVKDKPYLRLGTELANNYVVVYTNEKYVQQTLVDLGSNYLSFYPKIMSPLGSKSLDASGISRVLNQPFLNLTGRGVIIGIVDTGIDYTKDAFKFEDGTTKILRLWDQTIDGPRPDFLYFGAEYTNEQIDLALQSDNPFDIVPSFDEDGHGTFLASIAASNEKGEYMGGAPQAYLMVVKLKRADKYYIRRYLLPEDNPNLYESTDYMLGLKYIFDESEKLNLPIVICIGMGSNSSAHDGYTLFEDYLAFATQRAGYAVLTAAGNEANARHHTQGKVTERGVTTISLKVGQQGANLSVIIFGPAFDKVSVAITSPIGEIVSRIPFKSGLELSQKMVMEDTTVFLKYFRDINYNITVGLSNATQGIWEITLFGDSIVTGEYWAWLPITGQVSESVEFLAPVPEYTVVFPSTSLGAISCGAYNSIDNSLYVASSWGPTRLPRVAPDFVAPGVDVTGIYPTGYGTMTGTSVSAAVATGAAALLMEWGIIQNNMPNITGNFVRTLLISGCIRDKNQQYPSVKWGYGKLDLFESFTMLKETTIGFNVNLS